jgi:hypothetical protein
MRIIHQYVPSLLHRSIIYSKVLQKGECRLFNGIEKYDISSLSRFVIRFSYLTFSFCVCLCVSIFQLIFSLSQYPLIWILRRERKMTKGRKDENDDNDNVQEEAKTKGMLISL